MNTEPKSLTDRLPKPMQLWEKSVSGVGICVIKDLEFVEQKDCDQNNLQTLTLKNNTNRQRYLIINVYM